MTKTAKKPSPKNQKQHGVKNRLPKVPEKKSSKIDWDKMERDAVTRLVSARSALAGALLEEADAKDAHKSASDFTKIVQARVNAIANELSEIRRREVQPSLFDQKPSDNGHSETNGQAGSEDWRKVTLAELQISGKLAELLEDADLKTLGAIVDYEKSGKRLEDLKGIKGEKAAKIADLCADWWKGHPQPEKAPASSVTVKVEDGNGQPMPEESEKLQAAIDKSEAERKEANGTP